jgi:pyrimidine operon attenuation protein/uracil phosphoribosyltransferase
VLADRGGRELPVAPTACAWAVTLAPGDNLVLGQDGGGQLAWRLENA